MEESDSKIGNRDIGSAEKELGMGIAVRWRLEEYTWLYPLSVMNNLEWERWRMRYTSRKTVFLELNTLLTISSLVESQVQISAKSHPHRLLESVLLLSHQFMFSFLLQYVKRGNFYGFTSMYAEHSFLTNVGISTLYYSNSIKRVPFSFQTITCSPQSSYYLCH